MERMMKLAVAAAVILPAILAVGGCTRKKYEPKVQDGLTVYQDGNKYGYAGRMGGTNIRLEARYDFAWPFSEGLAVVEVNRKQGYINQSGEFVIAAQFDRAYEFSDGLARVRRMDGRYGFINKQGGNETGFEYDDATDFRNGVARVRISNRIGRIDKRGRFVETEKDDTFRYRPLNY